MGWDQSRFFPAFKRAGMLTDVTVITGMHEGEIVSGNLSTPDVVEASIGHSVPDFRFEYETADLASMSAGDQVQIGERLYRVIGSPLRQGDGFYSILALALNRVGYGQ